MARVGKLMLAAVISAALLGKFAGNGQTSAGPQSDLVAVSLHDLRISPDEDLMEFDCEIQGAVVAELKTPPGWAINLENGAEAGPVQLRATAILGVAAFQKKDLSYFDRFLVLARTTKSRRLSINIVVKFDDGSDKSQHRTLTFYTKDLTLTAVPWRQVISN